MIFRLFLNFSASFVTLIMPAFVFAGTDIGNGGDLIRCVPYASNDLNGLYSLDYLIFATETGAKASDAQSWEESIFRVRRLFVDKLPELLPVFDDFANNILNEDQSRRQIWEPTDYTLTELNDEELPASVKIPVNCRDNGKLQLVQAVIRQNPTFTGSKLIVYKYMPKMFEKMAKERPLQLSFLLVHEFLWSISDNVDRNRRINWFLHSEEIQNLSRLQVIDRLLGMGLDVKEVPRILDPKGRGHFTTLQDALAQAREGETIVVREGTYTTGGTSIVVPIRLVGEGDREKIIIKGTATSPALDVALEKDQELIIENLTVTRTVAPVIDEGPGSDMLVISSGGITFKNALLKGGHRFLFRIDNRQRVTLDGTTVTPADRGIWVWDGFRGSLTVKNSIFNTKRGWAFRFSFYYMSEFNPGPLLFENNRFEMACAISVDDNQDHVSDEESAKRMAEFTQRVLPAFKNNQYPNVAADEKYQWCHP